MISLLLNWIGENDNNFKLAIFPFITCRPKLQTLLKPLTKALSTNPISATWLPAVKEFPEKQTKPMPPGEVCQGILPKDQLTSPNSTIFSSKWVLYRKLGILQLETVSLVDSKSIRIKKDKPRQFLGSFLVESS